MSVYKINADYNAEGSVLTNSDDDFPSRLQVATKDSYGELRLSRADFESVLELVVQVVDTDEPDECSIEDGSFEIGAAPPTVEDTWDVKIEQGRLHYKFMLSDDELDGLADLLRTIHPDHDAEENDNVEVSA